MDAATFIDDMGGQEKLVAKLNKSLDQPMCSSTVNVWRNRNRIPDHVLVILMLDNRKLDPRKYGWKPKIGGETKARK